MRKVDRVYEILRGERWFTNLSLDEQGRVAVVTASAIEDLEEAAVIETARAAALN